MKLVVCLDKNGGMMYKTRRQSRDAVLMENLASYLKGRTIVVSPYSEELFSGRDIRFTVGDASVADAEDFVFVEDGPLPEAENVSEVVIYNWCTVYPSSRKFDLDMSAFKRISKEKFKGSSHEKITKEVFRK